MRNIMVFRALAVACVVAGLPAGLSAQREHPSGIPVDLVVPYAPRPVNAEGNRHLVYELHITNFGRADLILERIDVLSARGDTVLATYGGDSLSGVLSRPGMAAVADKRIVGPGLRAVAFLDAVTLAAAPTARGLRHRLTFAPVAPPNAPLQSIVEGGDVAVSSTGSIVLGPPLTGSGWLALNALSNESSHRRTLLAIDGRAQIAQRFAIDWTRVAPDGQVFHDDPSKNANWSPYGADVLAVGDGRVVEVQDGIPENDPTSAAKAVPITLTTVGGNYVILDLGRGRYAFYAHLQPGSLCVRPGDQVRRGQVLAKLGNSGQSDAPHLHLHIADAPTPLAAEGIPMVFDRFAIQGHVTSRRVLTDGTGWKPTAQIQAVFNEMPVENAVIAFPARRTVASCANR
jgi:murein DD-endopeptidase